MMHVETVRECLSTLWQQCEESEYCKDCPINKACEQMTRLSLQEFCDDFLDAIDSEIPRNE